MKYIMLVILLLSSIINASEYTDKRTRNIKIAITATPKMSCFVYEYKNIPKHKWQKFYVEYTPVWVLIDKDDTGFLVAQPVPQSHEGFTILTKDFIAPFWIRTVEYNDSWVNSNYEIVKCPSKLNKKFFLKNYHKQIDLQ